MSVYEITSVVLMIIAIVVPVVIELIHTKK